MELCRDPGESGLDPLQALVELVTPLRGFFEGRAHNGGDGCAPTRFDAATLIQEMENMIMEIEVEWEWAELFMTTVP